MDQLSIYLKVLKKELGDSIKLVQFETEYNSVLAFTVCSTDGIQLDFRVHMIAHPPVSCANYVKSFVQRYRERMLYE